jgi:hypothetical protein
MAQFRLPGGYNAAAENDIVQKGSDNLWYTRGPAEMIIPGRFLLRSVFTSGLLLQHNLNARTTKFRAYGQGPGGGGGGVNGEGSDTAAVGAAGQAGGYFDHVFTRIPGLNFIVYVVGVGGAGGNGSGDLDGDDGSTATLVEYDGLTIGGNPGLGGVGHIAVTAVPTFVISPVGGSILGSPDFGIAPRAGDFGMIFPLGGGESTVVSGAGGSSVLARGGAPSTTVGVGANGNAGVFGGGGSGAVVANHTAEPDGGPGGNGILIVEEYS